MSWDELFDPGMGMGRVGVAFSWGNLPVSPDPLPRPASAGGRLRHRVLVPASQSDRWLELVEQAIAG